MNWAYSFNLISCSPSLISSTFVIYGQLFVLSNCNRVISSLLNLLSALSGL